MAPYIVGSLDSFTFSPSRNEGGISATDSELTFAAGGDPPARATESQIPPDEFDSGETPSDDEDEDDSDIFVNPTPEYPKLDHAARLSGYVHELTEVALARFFTRSALQIQFPRRRNTEGDYQYPQPPSARGPAPHSRRRKSNADDTSRLAAPSFVCPFYVLKPVEYRGCLKHDLRRILDVKRHLWAAHHIRSGGGQCDPTTDSEEPIVSDDQLERLAAPPSPDLEDEAQWLSIWSIVFKDVAQPSPSHIVCNTEDLVQKLDVLRGFWKAQGIKIIGGFLESKGIPADDPRREQRNLEALHGIVLNRMVDTVLAGLN
ncbi:hypothetical protein B0T16DRAFT_395185 [Cercophora newfieldiana]|uniref:Uncharacterized protein n=1 Tax=Cercophora newfieldiana TaxID=92897 RepID=A0AA40CID2_9PEZI|nr:hypothetical protein B0T16DRAFT_395185 [Cercophora newfieldiana]